MARALYGYTPGDFGVAEDGTNSDALIIAGSTLDIYDEPGGTAQTDLLDSAGDAATQVVTVAGATITFQGPDAWDKDLYGTPDSGTTWYRFAPSVDPLVDRVAALEAGSSPSALDDLDDVATTGATDGQALVYNSGTDTWAPGTVATDNANALLGVVITDGGSSDAYPDNDFLVFRPVA